MTDKKYPGRKEPTFNDPDPRPELRPEPRPDPRSRYPLPQSNQRGRDEHRPHAHQDHHRPRPDSRPDSRHPDRRQPDQQQQPDKRYPYQRHQDQRSNEERRPYNQDHYADGHTGSQVRPSRGNDYRDRNTHGEYGNNSHPDQQGTVTRYPVEFHGKTSEYFKIWIVNIFLTIITLYIYSAWAKVRTKRYFYGNTTIDGSTFEYHATGKQLVVGRLIAAALLIVYTVSQGISATLTAVAFATIVLLFPWAIWRSLKFNARASSFRNIRFGFDGKASTPYFNFLVIPLIVFLLVGVAGYLLYLQFGPIDFNDPGSASPELLAIIGGGFFLIFVLVFSIIIPYIHRNLISYSHNNHRYGTAKFSANIRTGRIFGIHFVTLLLSFLTIAFVGGLIFGAIKLVSTSSFLSGNLELLDRIQPHMEAIVSVAVYLILIPASGFAVAYFQSSIRNHRYNATTIDSRVEFHSTVGLWSLWWLSFSNLLLIILTIGFAYPYTKIRSARYFARHTSVTVAGGLQSFTENERTKLSAMGEEMADAFDVEFNIGV